MTQKKKCSVRVSVEGSRKKNWHCLVSRSAYFSA
jgi:hypothetical protein